MQPNYYTIEEMLAMIDEPNRGACVKILNDNKKLFQLVQGSPNNHQAWPGGYYDHVQEAMNIAVVLYERLDSLRQLPFSLSDLLLVMYLHDIEKPWKYEFREDGQLHHKPNMQNKDDYHNFRVEKMKEYGVTLTPAQENGIRYAEGELDDYSNTHRVMSQLASLAHMCDVASARLWFNHPIEGSDLWVGARRIRD